MKKLLFVTGAFLSALHGITQNSVDNLLQQIEKNNKSILSSKKYAEAKKWEFSTGLTPYDPQVEYDYLFGSPAGAGNQKDFSVTQRFDFPSFYSRKKELSKQQIAQTNLQQQVQRQDILLEAKLVIYELIYLNKKSAELQRRLAHIAQLVEDYQKKLDKGEVIILDVNKARLQLLTIENEIALNQNAIQIAHTRMQELNGGLEATVSDTLYPAILNIPDFDILDSIIEANDPVIKVYEQEKLIQEKQIGVQKSLNLPKFETGYHSQGILGQSYRGVHAGIVVPLWENKNRLKAARANVDYANESIAAHRIEHQLANKRLYDQLAVRKKAMQNYDNLVSSLNNTALLDKALKFGQITAIQYFMELGYFYAAHDRRLQLEYEYYKAVVELYKYML
jgi:cobalt-zinc-cadmium efflux system outer membrane protein